MPVIVVNLKLSLFFRKYNIFKYEIHFLNYYFSTMAHLRNNQQENMKFSNQISIIVFDN